MHPVYLFYSLGCITSDRESRRGGEERRRGQEGRGEERRGVEKTGEHSRQSIARQILENEFVDRSKKGISA